MKLIIDTVKKVSVRLYNEFDSCNTFNAFKTEGISLLVNGTLEDGSRVYFYTPTDKVSVSTGIVNMETLQHTVRGWFKTVKGESIYHDSKIGNGVIEVLDSIQPNIVSGDEIDIKFSIKRQCKNGIKQLNRVNIVTTKTKH